MSMWFTSGASILSASRRTMPLAAVVNATTSSRILMKRQLRTFSAFAKSLPLQEKIKMKVPTMGDSITEGTIVEWTVQAGQTVKENDVICMIETDKVTIDIKAEFDGVILSLFGSVDDTVAVGSDLYQIDTETITTTVSSDALVSSDPKPDFKTASVQVVSIPELYTSHNRSPSIRFLGKSGWAQQLQHQQQHSDDDTLKEETTTANQDMRNTHQYVETIQLVPDDVNWNPMYGRPPVSEIEIECLVMGGASQAPKLLRPSSGAIFE